MEFTKYDVGIFISMSIVVISASFLFPALGMQGNSVNSTDIPEFNITTDRFGGYLEKPEKPGAPNQGIINHSSTKFDDFEGSIQVELGEGTSGERIFLVAIEPNETHIVNTSILDNHTFSSNDEITTLSGDGYEIDVSSNNITFGEFEYRVDTRPGDSTWYKALPFIGGIFSTGEQLAAIVGWIGSILFFYLIQLGSTILNTVTILFQLISFFISFMHWLITTYFSIIANAPTAWASAIIAIPAILLSLEFIKVVMVFIGLLPTT